MDQEQLLKYLQSFCVDLAAERLGGVVLYATDDFFAEKENLIKPGRGVFIPDKYTERGKWMDGWESRRRRDQRHDWAVIQLATQGRILGFDIDTNHFLGNHPQYASVEGISLRSDDTIEQWDKLPWRLLLQKSPLEPGSQNVFACDDDGVYTHIRLHIYPDGGVARFRVYGQVEKDWSEVDENVVVDLGAAIEGARPLACSDMFFSNMSNLTMPGRGINMGDGWETKRSRVPGHSDWVIIKLAGTGVIREIIVDTAHFKGNYPESCLIEGCRCDSDDQVLKGDVDWIPSTGREVLAADQEHMFISRCEEPLTHVRLTIYPDGGVSRLRLMGNIVGS